MQNIQGAIHNMSTIEMPSCTEDKEQKKQKYENLIKNTGKEISECFCKGLYTEDGVSLQNEFKKSISNSVVEALNEDSMFKSKVYNEIFDKLQEYSKGLFDISTGEGDSVPFFTNRVLNSLFSNENSIIPPLKKAIDDLKNGSTNNNKPSVESIMAKMAENIKTDITSSIKSDSKSKNPEPPESEKTANDESADANDAIVVTPAATTENAKPPVVIPVTPDGTLVTAANASETDATENKSASDNVKKPSAENPDVTPAATASETVVTAATNAATTENDKTPDGTKNNGGSGESKELVVNESLNEKAAKELCEINESLAEGGKGLLELVVSAPKFKEDMKGKIITAFENLFEKKNEDFFNDVLKEINSSSDKFLNDNIIKSHILYSILTDKGDKPTSKFYIGHEIFKAALSEFVQGDITKTDSFLEILKTKLTEKMAATGDVIVKAFNAFDPSSGGNLPKTRRKRKQTKKRKTKNQKTKNKKRKTRNKKQETKKLKSYIREDLKWAIPLRMYSPIL